MIVLNELRPDIVIPQEICGIICQDTALKKSDLHTLCAVSNAFREEAERLLYRSVELKEEAKIRLFCITVTRRPFLLRGMRKLVLHLVPQQDTDPDDLSRLGKMLRLSTNLQDLRMLGYTPTQSANAIHNWLLEGHEFKLTTFANSYFMQSRLKNFLESQSELETLILTRHTSTGLRNTLISSLKNLSCSALIVQELIDANCTMNLERLKVTVSYWMALSGPDEFFQRMKTQLGEKLQALSIQISSDWKLPAVTSSVATHYPAIKYLEILDYMTAARSTFPFDTKLTHIETLNILPSEVFPGRYLNTLPDLHTDAGQLAIATKFMDTYPTLKRLALYINDKHGPCDYIRTSPPALNALEARGHLFVEDEWLKVAL